MRSLFLTRLSLAAAFAATGAFAAPASATFPGRNGKLLVLAGNCGGLASVCFDYLYTVNPDGSQFRSPIEAEVDSAVFSADGRRIGFIWYRGLSTTTLTGRGTRLIVRVGQAAEMTGLAWSPSGRRIAFARRKLVPGPDGPPAYGDPLTSHILTVRSDGSGLRDLGPGEDPDWSPDGRWIAFVRRAGGSASLYRMRPDGEDVRQITNGSQSDSSPSWSPDGKLVAFTRCDSSGPCRDEITTPDGSGQRLLSRNSWPPTWSPDGRKILFRCDLGACWVRPTGGRLHPLVAVNRKLKAHIGLSDDDMFFDWQAR